MFWKDVFKAWLNLSKLEDENFDTNSISNMPLWFNEKIQVDNSSVFYKNWYRKGFVVVNDLKKNDNEFFNYLEFRELYGVTTNFLQFQGIIISIKVLCGRYGVIHPKIENSAIPQNLTIFLKNKKGSKDFYIPLSKNNVIATGR